MSTPDSHLFRIVDVSVLDVIDEEMDETVKIPSTNPGVTPPTELAINRYKFIIRLFGIDKRGDNYGVYVKNFTPFFYIRIKGTYTKKASDYICRKILKSIYKHY